MFLEEEINEAEDSFLVRMGNEVVDKF